MKLIKNMVLTTLSIVYIFVLITFMIYSVVWIINH